MAHVRFRTQDTRANWARKFAQLGYTGIDLSGVTREQSAKRLNHSVRLAALADYDVSKVGLFRIGDTRQNWARNLNNLSAALEAGPVGP